MILERKNRVRFLNIFFYPTTLAYNSSPALCSITFLVSGQQKHEFWPKLVKSHQFVITFRSKYPKRCISLLPFFFTDLDNIKSNVPILVGWILWSLTASRSMYPYLLVFRWRFHLCSNIQSILSPFSHPPSSWSVQCPSCKFHRIQNPWKI